MVLMIKQHFKKCKPNREHLRLSADGKTVEYHQSIGIGKSGLYDFFFAVGTQINFVCVYSMDDIEVTSSFNVHGAHLEPRDNQSGVIGDGNRRKNGNFRFIMSIAKAGFQFLIKIILFDKLKIL